MQSLKKLIQIIGYKHTKNLLLFEKQLLREGKELSLFRGIVTGNFQNERHAAKSLYASEPEDTRYTILKSRLEEKLLNFLVFIELNEGSYKQGWKPENRCEMQLYQALALFRRGEFQMSERVAKKALRLAKEYEFTFLTVKSLELLLSLYSITGTESQFMQTKEAFETYEKILAIEHRAGLLYKEVKLKLKTGNGMKEVLVHVSDVVIELQNLWKQSNSFVCFNYYYRLHVKQLQLEGKYHQLLVLTTFSEEFLRDLKINHKRFDQQHNLVLGINACLRTGDLESGLQMARNGLPLFEQGTDAWFSYQENYFLLLMHAQQYPSSYEILRQVEESFVFEKSAPSVKERWYLFKVYLQWMYPFDTSIQILEEALVKQMMPLYRKDKQGYNIAILTLQFCHFLYANRKDYLSKKVDSYKKYIERHMQNNALDRERIFFLLILLVIRHNFQYEQIKRKSIKLVTQLKECTLSGGASVSKIEIVPYEHLWNHLANTIAAMEKNKKYLKTPESLKRD